MNNSPIDKKLYDLPYADFVRDNETITLRSVFDFTGGCDELFPFLYGCEQRNCTVVFENEGLTVAPKENDKTNINVLLSMYAAFGMKDSKIAKDYIRYLCKITFEYNEPTRKPVLVVEQADS